MAECLRGIEWEYSTRAAAAKKRAGGPKFSGVRAAFLLYNGATLEDAQIDAGGENGTDALAPCVYPPFLPEEEKLCMAKTICKILGIAFILIGILGFLAPGMMGFHLSLAHNLIHLVSGALALYFGFAGTLSGARAFCIAFGVVYGLLGVAGYALGTDRQHTLAGVPAHGSDSNLLQVIAGQLELASMDHGLHILLGIVFLIAGLLTKANTRDAAY